VIVPTHNRWSLLQRTLASAPGQKDATIEVIVVDDCSTDGTTEGLSGMPDKRVRFLRNETRNGPGKARNKGIASARADWIAFLDDDDLWSPDKLRVQLETASEAGASFVYGHSVLIDEVRRVVTRDV